MKQVFESTREMAAHIFLDGDNGMAPVAFQDREDFVKVGIANMYGADKVFMIYVGGGFDPLAFAVIAQNEYDAQSAMEEYCRDNDRLDEIGEDDPDSEYFGEYESVCEQVPDDVIAPLKPTPEPEPEALYRTVETLAGSVVLLRYRDTPHKLTGTVRKYEGYQMEVEVHPFDKPRYWRYFIRAYEIMRWPR